MAAADSLDQRLATDGQASDPPPVIGADERRMHVRAYNFWVSLLGGRPFPAVADLDPATITDFGPNSVLIDFRQSAADPTIAFLGRALRDEGGIDETVRTVAQVPDHALLARLTGHYGQIIANRAPIGFEAEFVNARGTNTMYRGILLPFSSDGRGIDYIYGVINWKELADAALTAAIVADADRAIAAARAQAAPAPSWADGPSRSFAATPGAGFPTDPVDLTSLIEDDAGLLADLLAAARECAQTAAAAEHRARVALYRALAHAYALAIAAEEAPDALAGLLADGGIRRGPRASMLPLVKLVFGGDHDPACLTEYAATLAHARRYAVAEDDLFDLLEDTPGGIRAIVAAERAARRESAAEAPAAGPDQPDSPRPAHALSRLPARDASPAGAFPT